MLPLNALLLASLVFPSSLLLFSLSRVCTVTHFGAAKCCTWSAPYAWLAIAHSLLVLVGVGGGMDALLVRCPAPSPRHTADGTASRGIFPTSALPHGAFAQSCCLLD